jgi:hypothetical protein
MLSYAYAYAYARLDSISSALGGAVIIVATWFFFVAVPCTVREVALKAIRADGALDAVDWRSCRASRSMGSAVQYD